LSFCGISRCKPSVLYALLSFSNTPSLLAPPAGYFLKHSPLPTLPCVQTVGAAVPFLGVFLPFSPRARPVRLSSLHPLTLPRISRLTLQRFPPFSSCIRGCSPPRTNFAFPTPWFRDPSLSSIFFFSLFLLHAYLSP